MNPRLHEGGDFEIHVIFDAGEMAMMAQVEPEGATQHSHAGHNHYSDVAHMRPPCLVADIALATDRAFDNNGLFLNMKKDLIFVTLTEVQSGDESRRIWDQTSRQCAANAG